MLNESPVPTSPYKALLDQAPTPLTPCSAHLIFSCWFLSPEYSLPDCPFSWLIPFLILPIRTLLAFSPPSFATFFPISQLRFLYSTHCFLKLLIDLFTCLLTHSPSRTPLACNLLEEKEVCLSCSLLHLGC